MTKDEAQPEPAEPEARAKPAGRTGEGCESIVAELAQRHRQVDDLVNHAGQPDPEPEPGEDAP